MMVEMLRVLHERTTLWRPHYHTTYQQLYTYATLLLSIFSRLDHSNKAVRIVFAFDTDAPTLLFKVRTPRKRGVVVRVVKPEVSVLDKT